MNKVLTIIFSVLFAILFSSLFIIYEGNKGIVLRFGKILRNVNNIPVIYEPGIHIKLPFFEAVKILDYRIQTTSNQTDRVVTKDKKNLIIDSYIHWKINDFSRYYLATRGDNFQTEILLKRKFSDQLRSEIGQHSIQEIMVGIKSNLITKIKNSLNNEDINHFNDDHNNFFSSSLKRNSTQLTKVNSIQELGIDVIDICITKIDLPIEIYNFIYNKMKIACKLLAQNQRLKGQEEAEKLKAIVNYEVIKKLSQAHKQELVIQGEAEAIISKAFSSAFRKEPDFYAFLRSLQAYEKIFKNSQDFILININNNKFFDYMRFIPKA